MENESQVANDELQQSSGTDETLHINNFTNLVPNSAPLKKSCMDKFQKKLSNISFKVSSRIEKAFYIYGKFIGLHPSLIIILSLLLTVLCGFGLSQFTTEERPYKLWIPQDSDFIQIQKWAREKFPSKFRFHSLILEGENVLSRNSLIDLLNIHDNIKSLEYSLVVNNATNGSATEYEIYKWDNICYKLPVVPKSIFGRKKRSANYNGKQILNEDESYSVMEKQRFKRQAVDFSTYLSRDLYCDLVDKLQQECFERSILEVWGYDRDIIESLTDEQIIEDINTVETSAVYGYSVNFSTYLGGIQKDETTGKIIGANATKVTLLTEIQFDKIVPGEFIDSFGSGVEVDEGSYRWEEVMVQSLGNISHFLHNDLYYMSSHSFSKLSKGAIEGDVGYLVIGYTVVFIYVQIMLGKFNWIETRPFLSFIGLTSVAFSIIISYGVCSALGWMFGPVNNILPFLLLGLGIDDMFVIMQAFDNLSEREKREDLPERIGLALRHSGASILVTSTTDIAAFAIGSATVLPALRSFCLYASVGIATIFFFQSTYFVAWLYYDQKRIESKRNAIICCYEMKNWHPNRISQRNYCQLFFSNVLAKALKKPLVKIFVLLFTFSYFGVSCWGSYNLKQEFDPIWFIPGNTYLAKYFQIDQTYFKNNGENGDVFLGDVDIRNELSNIEDLIEKMKANPYIEFVDGWYSSYKKYYEDQGYDIFDPYMTDEEFNSDLSFFLFSPSGSRYREINFRFNSSVSCSEPAPNVTVSTLSFGYVRLQTTKEKISAMNSVKELVASSNISGYVVPFARIHSSWETDEIIERELYRNIALALIVIYLMVLFLITSVLQSIFVLSCVFMTLIDVGALMHWWGLTIDTVSCIDIVLAIGLCVDYAVHVGHTFMICQGTRNDRMGETLGRIGPAVLNGGFSTFLAFCLLANSNSHVFITFFKIFFGVCLFGLYHGLVYLPVVLSLFGPRPYEKISHDSNVETEKATNEELRTFDTEENQPQKSDDPQVKYIIDPEKVKLDNSLNLDQYKGLGYIDDESQSGDAKPTEI